MLDGFGKKVRHGLFHRSWSCERYGLLYVSYLDDGLSDLIRIPIELFLLSAKNIRGFRERRKHWRSYSPKMLVVGVTLYRLRVPQPSRVGSKP